jgi:methanol metabolism-related c-type cytochrome
MTAFIPPALAGAALLAMAGAAVAVTPAAPPPDTASASVQDGKHFTADEVPTFAVAPDGTVDWYSFSGFRRYHAECHVCHGPDGEGSSYAPALKDSVMRLSYDQFMEAVASGIQRVGATENQVMPAFGANRNVMCYIDDIYIYLRARGAEAIPRGRPAKRADKPEAFAKAENECLG